MKPINYEFIGAPIDRVASRVVFGKAEHWTPKQKPNHTLIWSAPPLPRMKKPEGARDFTGIRRGYMTAIRYHDKSKNSGSRKGSFWLCRCDCGNYELRIASHWAHDLTRPDACQVCRKTAFITGKS